MNKKELLAKAIEILNRIEQDINWMMNNERLLNYWVFEYLHDGIEEIEEAMPSQNEVKE